MKVIHLYIIKGTIRKACTALYTDVRKVRQFVECIRLAAPTGTDVVLTETRDGFRIEVYL